MDVALRIKQGEILALKDARPPSGQPKPIVHFASHRLAFQLEPLVNSHAELDVIGYAHVPKDQVILGKHSRAPQYGPWKQSTLLANVQNPVQRRAGWTFPDRQ